jgi:hypothetical protein
VDPEPVLPVSELLRIQRRNAELAMLAKRISIAFEKVFVRACVSGAWRDLLRLGRSFRTAGTNCAEMADGPKLGYMSCSDAAVRLRDADIVFPDGGIAW